MELTQLEYFKAVAELEHMSKAAEQLGVSQPTLSSSIQRLELELGARLFDRKGRYITLNPCGKMFLSSVNSVLFQLDKAKYDVSEYIRHLQSTINIDGVSVYIFPGLVESILEKYPNVIINCPYNVNNLSQSLLSQKVDFCISMIRLTDAQIISDQLANRRLVLVAPSKSELAGRSSVKLSELRNYNFASGRQDSILWSNITAWCGEAGFAPKITHVGRSNQDIFAAVKSGNQISIVTDFYANSLKNEQISIIDIDGLPLQPIYISYCREQKENAFIISVIEIVKKYFREYSCE